MHDLVLRLSERNLQYAVMHLEDIEDARMCVQPAGLTNHPAWIVGHIASSMDLVLRALGRQANLPEPWNTLFGWGSKATAVRAAYPSKADLLQALQRQHQAVAGALAATSAETLEKPLEDERLRQFMPTIGEMVCSPLTNHQALHLGQLSAWRLAMGMSLKF
jgi:hypothetical protein